jgi:hypothetical protein
VPLKKRAGRLQSWIIERFLNVGSTWARRNVDLMRSLVQLRDEHAQCQSRFSALEKFVAGLPGIGRTAGVSLPTGGRLAALEMANGGILEQRIPLESAGLSDVAVSLAGPAPENGVLLASLHTLEDGETAATWRLPSDMLAAGEIRLSLPTALGPDSRTAALRLAWAGGAPLHLAASLMHPDPRFQATMDGRAAMATLAVRTWKYVAGCAAPIPSDGHLPVGNHLHARVVAANELARAENMNADNAHFRFIPDLTALQVHPESGGGVAAGRLVRALGAGAARVRARVHTRHAEAAEIEYALGVMPSGSMMPAPEMPPTFARGCMTAWCRLPPLGADQLDLALPEPVSEPHDLYLMTRLPDGQTAEWAWATFDTVIVSS